MKSSLKNMVVVLFSITAVAALLVGLVNNLTYNTILETEIANKAQAKLDVLPAFEGTATYEEVNCSINDGSLNVCITKVMDGNGELVGYAVEAPSITKNGYADRIHLMVGFVETEEGTIINGVKVLSQKETPGLGANMIVAGNVLERSVVGNNPATMVFKVKKDDASGSFDALTGSTISSRAYTNAVETAYAGYLWAKHSLPRSHDAESGATETAEDGDAVSGATKTAEEGDAVSGATLNEESSEDGTSGATLTNEEPEAQKGEISNE